MIWTVPNILTMARIAAAPLLVITFALLPAPENAAVALAIFVVASLTDFVDGWLARSLDQISAIGKMLDPIADKVMVLSALLALASTPYGGMWPFQAAASVIVAREVLVSGLREYLGDVKLPVTRIAKWKTTAQMAAIAALFAVAALNDGGTPRLLTPDQFTLAHLAAQSAFALAAVLTAVSGWDYFAKGLAYILAREDR